MRTKIRLAIGLLFVIGIILIHLYGGFEQFSIENLRAWGDKCMLFIHEHYGLGVLTYMVIYATAIIFALPIATVMTLASGFLFGVVWGTVYAIIAATIGATCSFILVRYCLGDIVQAKYGRQLHTFNEAIAAHGVNYLIIVRLIPVIPFFLVNLLAAMTVISLPSFIIATFFGVIPSKCIFSFVGQQLHYIDSFYDVFSLRILAVFALLALLASLPVIMRLIQKRRARS